METRMGGHDMTLDPVGEDDQRAMRRSPISPRRTRKPGRLLEQEPSMRLRSEGLEQALENLDARSRRIIEARG